MDVKCFLLFYCPIEKQCQRWVFVPQHRIFASGRRQKLVTAPTQQNLQWSTGELSEVLRSKGFPLSPAHMIAFFEVPGIGLIKKARSCYLGTTAGSSNTPGLHLKSLETNHSGTFSKLFEIWSNEYWHQCKNDAGIFLSEHHVTMS